MSAEEDESETPRAAEHVPASDGWKGFPSGNRFWEARSSAGRRPKFATAEHLARCVQEYFTWVENNPLWEAKLVTYEGVSKLENIPKARVMTLGSLLMFLDITQPTWYGWRRKDDEEQTDFSFVVRMADAAIRENKFGGAAAGFFNANIIARDLGLVDRIEQKSAPKRVVTLTTTDPGEAARAYAEMMAQTGDEDADQS